MIKFEKIAIFEKFRNYMQKTSQQFDEILKHCQDLFTKKLQDYGPAFRVLRASSITDQLFIKASRIRTLQMTDDKKVDESEEDEFVAIVNYSIIGFWIILYSERNSKPESPEQLYCNSYQRILRVKYPR